MLDEFLKARWPDYRLVLDAVLPGAFEQAVTDAPHILDTEIAGLLDWRFGQEEAKRITQPVLAVVGEESLSLWDRFGETQRFLLNSFSDVEGYVLPRATHFLQLQNPGEMAEALGAFFEHHPLKT
jgi:pimeloyl-ACP methyl ester carboxylesterase